LGSKAKKLESVFPQIIKSAESLSEIQKPTLVSSSSAHSLPCASPPKSPCPAVTPSMLIVVCKNNFPKQCTGPATLKAAILTTACRRPQRDMVAQFYPTYFNGGDGCHLTVKVQCVQMGPSFVIGAKENLGPFLLLRPKVLAPNSRHVDRCECKLTTGW
jgi:hypothetical protein